MLVRPFESRKNTGHVTSLKNYWYIACLSNELKKAPLARQILNTFIVLFRASDGSVAALEDRCVHRNAPLSQGKVCGNTVQCPYHGWRYDENGELQEIPSLGHEYSGDLPKGVRSFHCVEQQGYVWINLSSSAVAEKPPKFPELGVAGWTSFRMKTHFAATVDACLENFLDCPHAAYVHRGWFRSPSKKAIKAVVKCLSDGAVAEYFDEPREQSLVWRLLTSAKAEMKHTDRFIVPSTSCVEYSLSNGVKYTVTSSCTPVSDESTMVYTVICFKMKWIGWLVKLYFKPLSKIIIKQDVKILACQQENVKRFCGPKFTVMKTDLLYEYIKRWRSALTDGTEPPAVEESREVDLYL